MHYFVLKFDALCCTFGTYDGNNTSGAAVILFMFPILHPDVVFVTSDSTAASA